MGKKVTVYTGRKKETKDAGPVKSEPKKIVPKKTESKDKGDK
jgi:hypothetical protein